MEKEESKRKEEEEIPEQEKKTPENTYDELLNKLRNEIARLEQELKHEYRNARQFVRTNPEQGVGIAFVGGVLIGVILARLMQK